MPLTVKVSLENKSMVLSMLPRESDQERLASGMTTEFPLMGVQSMLLV